MATFEENFSHPRVNTDFYEKKRGTAGRTGNAPPSKDALARLTFSFTLECRGREAKRLLFVSNVYKKKEK